MPNTLLHLLDLIRSKTEHFHPDTGIRPCQPDELPESARSLLVHDRDMTSTLEAHHGSPLKIRTIESQRQPAPRPEHQSEYRSEHAAEHETLIRQVILLTVDTQTPVEFGAIRINLRPFEPDARQAVLNATTPLGAILDQHNVPYTCHPSRFFIIEDQTLAESVFGVQHQGPLYGRQNTILHTSGQPIAEVAEILAPQSLGPSPKHTHERP